MKSTLPASLLLLITTATIVTAGVTIDIGEISDKRTTGEFFSGLELKLLVSGAEMESAKAMRVTIDKATDNTGKNLLDGKKQSFREGEFAPLEKPFGSKPAKAGTYETEVNLANPPREAKTVSVSGTIELLSPSADPSSVVTADLSGIVGKPLDSPAIKAAGVEITFEAPKDNSITYKLKDPGKKVAVVEFCDASGKKLESNSSSYFGFGASKNCTISIPNLPGQVSVRIQLLTDKAVMKVPLKLEQVKLP